MAQTWLFFDGKEEEKISKTWEKLNSHTPCAFLNQHPSGEFVAMQASSNKGYSPHVQSAIWSTKTHRIVWADEGAIASCWSEKGDEILVLSESYHPDSNHPTYIATPLQSEFSYYVMRLTWPDCKTISSCGIDLPMGWPVDIVASLNKPIGCVVWVDQTEAGIEIISWQDGKLKQLKGCSYFGKGSNLIQGPTFSPNSQFLAFSYGKELWWEDDEFLQSNEQEVGKIITCDISSWSYQETPVFTSVPENWPLKDPPDPRNELISSPEFIDKNKFIVRLPTGEVKTFLV